MSLLRKYTSVYLVCSDFKLKMFLSNFDHSKVLTFNLADRAWYHHSLAVSEIEKIVVNYNSSKLLNIHNKLSMLFCFTSYVFYDSVYNIEYSHG